MDKAILGLTAQKIRELFTICGIEDSEEHLNLVIAHAADHGEFAPRQRLREFIINGRFSL